MIHWYQPGYQGITVVPSHVKDGDLKNISERCGGVWSLVSTIFPMFAGWLFMKVVGAHLPDIHIYKIVAPRETHNSSFRDFCQVSCGTDWTSANLGFPISGVRWDDKRFVTFYRFKINLNKRDRTDIRYSDFRRKNQDKWSETPKASVNNLVKQKVLLLWTWWKNLFYC